MAQDKDIPGGGDDDTARQIRKEQEDLARKGAVEKAKDGPKEEELERARRESAAKRAE